jgi:hypothetical protein
MSKKFDFLYERKKKVAYKPLQLELELPLVMPDYDRLKKAFEAEEPKEERGVLIIPL